MWTLIRTSILTFSACVAFEMCGAAQNGKQTLKVQEILQRSVIANRADWKAAPGFAFVERDVESKRGGPKTVKDYLVMMVGGSPYRRLIAVQDRPLTKEQDAQELRKLRKEAQRRAHEPADARQERVNAYQKERRQDQAMMNEMADAFSYTLAGEGRLAGRDVYILDASPKPGYQPKTRETRVLIGMRGRLWIDKQRFHWAKVEAEVFQPVSFGFFIAKVGPGTRFVLEEAPASPKVWLPVHFSVTVKASILGFNNNSTDDETYRDYRPNQSTLLQAMAK